MKEQFNWKTATKEYALKVLEEKEQTESMETLMDDNSDDRPVQFVESERDGFEAFSNY